MTFKFESMSEKDAIQALLIPEGTYECEILKIELQKNTFSNDGSEYLSLQARVLDGKTNKRVVFCNLYTSNPKKFRDFFYSGNLGSLYEKGELDNKALASLSGTPFKAEIIIKEDKSGKKDPSNQISKFIVPKEEDKFIDDDIPDFGSVAA